MSPLLPVAPDWLPGSPGIRAVRAMPLVPRSPRVAIVAALLRKTGRPAYVARTGPPCKPLPPRHKAVQGRRPPHPAVSRHSFARAALLPARYLHRAAATRPLSRRPEIATSRVIEASPVPPIPVALTPPPPRAKPSKPHEPRGACRAIPRSYRESPTAIRVRTKAADRAGHGYRRACLAASPQPQPP